MVRAPRLTRAVAIYLACLLLPVVAACGDSLLEANPDVAFLVGDWDATRLVVQSKKDPATAPDLIKLGATFFLNIQPSGQYNAYLEYQESSNFSPEMGLLEIEGQDIVFHVTVPESATNRSRLTVTAPDRITIVGDTEFPFVPGTDPQPAIATIDLKKR